MWAKEAVMSAAEIWEQRAQEQLSRAREFEAKTYRLEKQIYKLEDDVVLAVGTEEEKTAHAFCAVQWPDDTVTEMSVEENTEGDGTWWVRFLLDGTSMKLGGKQLPGGFAVTWWK